MPAFDDVKRSRFKMTIIGIAVVMPFMVFTCWTIYYAWVHKEFNIIAPFSLLGSLIASTIAGIGYYVKKETERGSLLNFSNITNTASNVAKKGKKILEGEDYSDPKEIPL